MTHSNTFFFSFWMREIMNLPVRCHFNLLRVALRWTLVQERRNNLLSYIKVNQIVFDKPRDRISDIFHLWELYEERDQVKKSSILHIFVPGKNWKGTFSLEHIGCWRVVYNDRVFKTPAYQGQVLYEYPIQEGAMLSEQMVRTPVSNVHLLHQRLCILTYYFNILYLGETSSVDDQFIVFAQLLQKVLSSRSFEHENVANPSFNINRDYIVRFSDLFKLTMH